MKNTTPDYFAISDFLLGMDRENSSDEESLALALEWHISVLNDGILTTFTNWFDFIDDYSNALLDLDMTKNHETISYLTEKRKAGGNILDITVEDLPYTETILEEERIQLLDQKISDLNLNL